MNAGAPGRLDRFVPSRLAGWVAFAWGFAEATLFFLVPDVFLTLLGMRMLRPALRAAFLALAGALLGGVLLYAWGGARPDSAERQLMSIPGIDSELVETVRTDVKERGELALLTGPLRGRPYKIYATVWSEADGFFAGFILTSIPARLVRFVLSALFARAIAHGIRHWTCERARIEVALWLAFWIAFYLFYFSVFGW